MPLLRESVSDNAACHYWECVRQCSLMFMYTCLISCKQFYEQCLKHEAGKTGSSTTCPGTQPFVSCSFVLLVCQLAHDVHRQTPRIDYWVFVYILVTSLLCWVSNRETLGCWLNQSCCESWHDAFWQQQIGYWTLQGHTTSGSNEAFTHFELEKTSLIIPVIWVI